MYNELLDERINATLIENDEITAIDFLDNLLKSYKETEAQVENGSIIKLISDMVGKKDIEEFEKECNVKFP